MMNSMGHNFILQIRFLYSFHCSPDRFSQQVPVTESLSFFLCFATFNEYCQLFTDWFLLLHRVAQKATDFHFFANNDIAFPKLSNVLHCAIRLVPKFKRWIYFRCNRPVHNSKDQAFPHFLISYCNVYTCKLGIRSYL